MKALALVTNCDERENADGTKFGIVTVATKVGSAKRIINDIILALALVGQFVEAKIVNVKTKKYQYTPKTGANAGKTIELETKNIVVWLDEDETTEHAYNASVKADQRAGEIVATPELAEVI